MTLVQRTLFDQGRQSGRRYTINHDAFADPLASEAGAYFLGLLMADGCVYRSGDASPGKAPYVALELQNRDAAVIVALADFIGSPREAVKTGSKYTKLRVSSATMAADLAVYGVVERKSLTATPHPEAEKCRHFWRGVVDGDGCIHVATAKRKASTVEMASLSLVGSRHVTEAFARTVADVAAGSRVNARRVGNYWSVGMTCSTAAKVIRHLYDGCTVAIERKRLLAEKVLSEMGEAGKRVVSREQTPLGDNPRGRHFLTFAGETLPVAEWSRRLGIPELALFARIRYGWPVERVLTQPHQKHGTYRGCSVVGCGRPHAAKGLCHAHYKRSRQPQQPASTARR